MSRAAAGLALVALLVAGALTSAAGQGVEGILESPISAMGERDRELEERVSKLAAELRCPTCQGLSIQASPSPLAQQMKELIRSQLADGRSEAEVRDYFVSRYGEWVLLEPRAAGFNLLVYLLPLAALLAGAGVIVVAVRRWTTPGTVDERP